MPILFLESLYKARKVVGGSAVQRGKAIMEDKALG